MKNRSYYKHRPSKTEAGLSVLVFLALVVGLFLLMGAVLAFVWNIAVPAIFGPTAPTLDLWAGTALWVLVGLIRGALR